MKHRTHPKYRSRGLSFIEVLGVVAIIGVIATVSFTAHTHIKESSEEAKMRAQVISLNRAVDAYLASGGSFAEASTSPQVLSKLATSADDLTSQQIAGFSGSTVDHRMRAKMQSTAEAGQHGQLRVLWNNVENRFIIAVNGDAGIKEFYLDETATAPATETRDAFMKVATNYDWVWDYDPDVLTSNTTAVDLVDTSTTDTGAGTEQMAQKQQLAPPSFGVSTGTFPIQNYPMGINVSNNNSSEDSKLYVSINGADWEYFENGVSVAPDSMVSAFAASLKPQQYFSSFARSEYYQADPTTLESPSISTSGSVVTAGTSVTVTMSNPNAAAVSKIQYQLASGAWTDYSAPFTVSHASFPSGVVINAKSVATQYVQYYAESAVATEEVNAQLAAPTFSLASLSEPVNQFPKTLTLSNPNTASSSIMFKVNSGAFSAYTGEISVPANTQITAFCTSDLATVLASAEASNYYEGISLTALSPPIITPNGGSFTDAVMVTITPGTGAPVGSRIFYSTDGTDPGMDTNGNPVGGTLYTGPVNLQFNPENYQAQTNLALDWGANLWNNGQGIIEGLASAQAAMNIGGIGINASLSQINGPSLDGPNVELYAPVGGTDLVLSSYGGAGSQFAFSIVFSEAVALDSFKTGGLWLHNGVQLANRLDMYDAAGVKLDLDTDAILSSTNSSYSNLNGGLETVGTSDANRSVTSYDFAGLGVKELRWNLYGYTNPNPTCNATFSVTNLTRTIGQTFRLKDYVTAGTNVLGKDYDFVYQNNNSSWHLGDFNANSLVTVVASDLTGGNTTPVGVYRVHLRRKADGTLLSNMTVTISNSGYSPASRRVSSFTLINADTDAPITGYTAIPNASTINLASLPTRNLNVRANTTGSTNSIGSVRFGYNGNNNFRTDNSSPYATFGGSGSDYTAWTPSLGSHNITGTPYQYSNAGGTVGTAMTINFTVVDSAAYDPNAVTGNQTVGNDDFSYMSDINFHIPGFSQPTAYNVIARIYPPVGPLSPFTGSDPASAAFNVVTSQSTSAVLLATPSITPASGTYTNQVSVTIAAGEGSPADVRLYYSLDGTEPRADGSGNPTTGTLYSGPFAIDAPTTPGSAVTKVLKARAFPAQGQNNAYAASAAASATYELIRQTVLQPPLIGFAATSGGSYSESGSGNFTGSVSVRLLPPASAPAGTRLSYTIDGSTPGVDASGNPTNATAYSAPFTLTYTGQRREVQTFTVKARAYCPNGQSLYYTVSTVASRNVSLEDPTPLQYFAGSSSAWFSGATGATSMQASYLSGGGFQWGNSNTSGYSSSVLDYDGYSFSNIAENQWFTMGNLAYYNGTSALTTMAHNVQFNLNFNLSTPNLSDTFEFGFNMINTANSTSNTANQNADYVQMGNLSSNFATMLNGKRYELELQFGYLGSLGFATIDEFHVHENANTEADLWGRFVEDLNYVP